MQKRPKKWTLIILVSSSMENVGADRAPGMVEKFRLTAVSWSRTITVLSSRATNNEGKGRYVLEEFSICSFTDYKKVGKLLSCRKYYSYRVILTKTFLYVDSFTRWKLCNNPFVKTTFSISDLYRGDLLRLTPNSQNWCNKKCMVENREKLHSDLVKEQILSHVFLCTPWIFMDIYIC